MKALYATGLVAALFFMHEKRSWASDADTLNQAIGTSWDDNDIHPNAQWVADFEKKIVANPKLLTLRDNDGETLVDLAVRKNSLATLQMLLKNGADPSPAHAMEKADDHPNALAWAVMNPDETAISKALIDKMPNDQLEKAGPNSEWTAAHYAALSANEKNDAFIYMIQKDPKLLEIKDEVGQTPWNLLLLGDRADLDAIKAVLKIHRGSIVEKDPQGNTPVEIAKIAIKNDEAKKKLDFNDPARGHLSNEELDTRMKSWQLALDYLQVEEKNYQTAAPEEVGDKSAH